MESLMLCFKYSLSRSFYDIYLVLRQSMTKKSISPFIDVSIESIIIMTIPESLLIYISSNATLVNNSFMAFIVQYIPERINTKPE